MIERQQDAPDLHNGEEWGEFVFRKENRVILLEVPYITMKKNSFVTMELGGIIELLNKYVPDMVL